MEEVEKVKVFWLEFNLDDRRTGLDRQCLEMRELKGLSTGGRKRLNELTRTFRSKTKEDQLVQMTELLKAYQEEIDQLSKRAKFAESSFFSLYKAVYEAPDPYPILEQLTSTISNSLTYPLEIERLKGEIAQYDIEFQQLKNQDITIRRLEEQLEEYKINVEEKVQKEIAKYALEVEDRADEKVRDIMELQKAAERRLAGAIEAMKQAQASAERAQSQLFEVSAQADNRYVALQTDNVMLVESAERAHARCGELEGEIENYKNVILNLQQSGLSKSLSSESNGIVTSNEEIETLQLVINDLRMELKKKDDSARIEKGKLETSLREANHQISKERDILSLTRKELAERPTKEDLINARRQLKILQSIAFNVNAEDEYEAESFIQDPENTLGDKMQLETLLTSRIKSLEKELSESRKDLREVQHKYNESKVIISELTINYDKAKELVSRLEADLESQISNPVIQNKGINSNKLNKQHELDLSRLLGVEDETNTSIQEASDNKNTNQMASILQAQRDRYKERLAQADSTIVELNQQLEMTKSKVQHLEEDNLALYAKIRYLHSYHGSSTPMNRSSLMMRGERYYDEERGGAGTYNILNVEIGDDIEKKYHSIYEKNMNPFAEFSEFEKQRKLRELTIADRIVLNTLQTVINNHAGRNFLIIYVGSMHLFVFLILYYNVHYVHRGCDTNLHN